MTRAPGFGVAIRNFCPSPEELSIDGIVDYGTRAEALGFDSAWVWDHILLGTRRPFPFLDSLSTLAALAMRTTRLRLGTGVLVLPLRNPVVLAKVLASVDQISKGRLILGVAAGWYEREFEACGVPFRGRGKTFVRNLEILTRLWTEEQVTGSVDGYVEAVLRRIARHGDGWLTYFYTPESFRKAWARIQELAREAGRDPATLRNVSQLPIYVARSFEEADRGIREFIGRYFDVAPWSESTPDSAIRGTPAQCAEQLAAHLEAGVEHIVFVPYEYRLDQLEAIARDVLPRLRPGATPAPA